MKEETGRRENVGAAIHFLSDSTLVLYLLASSLCFFYFLLFHYVFDILFLQF